MTAPTRLIQNAGSNDTIGFREALLDVPPAERGKVLLRTLDENKHNVGHFFSGFGNYDCYSLARRELDGDQRRVFVNQPDWNADTPVTCLGVLTPPFIKEPWPKYDVDAERIRTDQEGFRRLEDGKISLVQPMLEDGADLFDVNNQGHTAVEEAGLSGLDRLEAKLAELWEKLFSAAKKPELQTVVLNKLG
ncbi:MAG: hypothetical protein M1160_03990 [Candidatus Marsarchaeota archaeon]|nr:hypothetical protein [Candidatus Marsarchaeota archaeon]MCL5112002.1 hypothetical protein [Candidatus Marsarchaeota archaeon]